jgi:signal transduction histidine kinase
MATTPDGLQQQLDEGRGRLRDRERELAEALRELDRLGGLQAAFLSRISHDLRSPLNAVIGYARLVRRGAGPGLDERQQRNLENLQVSAHQLVGLIDDIAALSRAEAGRAPVRRCDLDAGSLVDACVAAATPRLGTGVTLDRQVDDGLIVHSDLERLTAALDGLLMHAGAEAKAAHLVIRAQRAPAGVEIAVVAPPGTAAGPWAPGPGAARPVPGGPPGPQGADRPRLGVVRRLVEMLGGSLSVTTDEATGTTLAILLPSAGP